MPKSAKPRKKYRAKESHPFHGLMMPSVKTNLSLPVHVSLTKAKMNISDEFDYNNIAACVNLAFMICEHQELTETQKMVANALDVLRQTNRNLNGLTTDQFDALALAVEISDELTNRVSPMTFTKALQEVIEINNESLLEQENEDQPN